MKTNIIFKEKEDLCPFAGDECEVIQAVELKVK